MHCCLCSPNKRVYILSTNIADFTVIIIIIVIIFPQTALKKFSIYIESKLFMDGEREKRMCRSAKFLRARLMPKPTTVDGNFRHRTTRTHSRDSRVTTLVHLPSPCPLAPRHRRAGSVCIQIRATGANTCVASNELHTTLFSNETPYNVTPLSSSS